MGAPRSTSEQAFRLLEVGEMIGRLQEERNRLISDLGKIGEVRVAHGQEFDVIIQADGTVRKAPHADGPEPQPVPALVSPRELELELQRCLKKIFDNNCVPSVRLDGMPDQIDFEVPSAGRMFVTRKG